MTHVLELAERSWRRASLESWQSVVKYGGAMPDSDWVKILSPPASELV